MAHPPRHGLDDVRDPASFILQLPAYGWPQARRLAQMGTKVGLESIKAPDNNSESLALFGSGKSDWAMRQTMLTLLKFPFCWTTRLIQGR
jgi:hypothetical protein